MNQTFEIDAGELSAYGFLLANYPEVLAEEMARAGKQIGQHTTEAIRANIASGLKSKKKAGVEKVFKYRASDASKMNGDPGKEFVDFYTKWAANKIFDTGGSIAPFAAGALTVLTDAGRGPTGRRRYSAEQIRSMIAAGKMRLIKTSQGWIIVQPKGGLTKSGKSYRKNSRDIIIAVLKKRVKEPKRTDIYGVFEGQQAWNQEIWEEAVENAFARIDKEKK